MALLSGPLNSAHAIDAHGGVDNANPHGEHAHKHVIISTFTNRVVLGILLVFTILTIGAANFEAWFQDYFHIILPHWVNVFVCLSIATVKGVLVLLFFMQLRYDNPINTIIFVFSLFAFALFLGFTAIDLGNRDKIYEYKKGEILVGGGGEIKQTVLGDLQAGRTSTESIIQYRRRLRLEAIAKDYVAKGDTPDVAKQKAAVEFARLEAEAIHHRRGHGEEAEVVSTGNTSRPRAGTTSGLYDAKAPSEAGPHSEH